MEFEQERFTESQDSWEVLPETSINDIGSERFSLKNAFLFLPLFTVSVLGGAAIVYLTAGDVLQQTNLTDFQKENFAQLLMPFGYGAGFFGSLELAGDLGLIDKPNWSNLRGLWPF